MKVIDRLNKLPPEISSRINEIIREQNRSFILKKETDLCSDFRIQHVIRPTKTKEGREYWRGIQDKYYNTLNYVSDQEYLIFTMEGSQSEYTSIEAIRSVITHTAIRIQINKRSRKRHTVALRNAFWNYLYSTFDISLELIGESTNPDYPFNHSTVIHGISQHKNQLSVKDGIAMSSEEKIRSLKISI